MADCIEIVKPFADKIAEDEINGQTIGGIGSHILGLEGLVIDPAERSVAHDGTLPELPQYRKDGTKRDLDFLVLSTDSDDVAKTEFLAKLAIGDKLELSFFGLHAMVQLERQKRSLASLAKVFVSDRYAEVDHEGKITRCVKSLYPFDCDMDLGSLETWTLKVGNDYELPIPHPGTTIINYLTRSIGGLRPKDKEKVDVLTANVLNAAPWVYDWIMEGPGKSQIELARLLQTTRKPASRQGPLVVGDKDAYISIDPLATEDIVNSEAACVLADASAVRRRAIIAATAAKSKIVHIGENQQWLVSFWLDNIEPRISSIVKNES